jgi:hypothetical protein
VDKRAAHDPEPVIVVTAKLHDEILKGASCGGIVLCSYGTGKRMRRATVLAALKAMR